MLGTPSTAALTWSTACAGITAPAGTLAVRPRPPRLCVLYLLRKPAHRPCSGNTPNYLDNVNSATGLRGVDCSKFSVCTACFPGGAHDGGVPLINGRCTGYCSHLGYCGISEAYRNGGTKCTQESGLCINQGVCFDPQPTIDTWSAYSTKAAQAVKDVGVVQELCDEPTVCSDWYVKNCLAGRALHTTVHSRPSRS